MGRSAELRRADEALEKTGTIVLTGVAGVGKTRLARELQQRWKANGRATTWVAGLVASSRIPFGAFSRFLPSPRPDSGSPSFSTAELLLGARKAIQEQARGRRLLLAVDDAQFLDAASALLTSQLAMSGEGVAAVLTVREGEHLPGALADLLAEGRAERLELRPFSRAQIARMLELGLDGKVDGLLVQDVWKASGGNLLYLHELVEEAQESGHLACADGLWSLTGPLALGSRLRELIKSRFSHVDDATRQVLEVVAVGEPLRRTTLELVADADGVEDGVRHGLLEWNDEDGESVIRLAHPLYGEVLDAAMPLTRRKQVIARLVEAMEKTGANRHEDLLRYALWRLDLGEPPPVDLLLQAARRALESRSLALAERFARAGVDAGGGTQARILLAIVHYRQARWQEALADLDLIDPVDDAEVTEVAVLRASVLLWMPGRLAEAEFVLSDAEGRVTGRHWRAWLAATRAIILSFAGLPEEAVDIAAPLVDLAEIPSRPMLAALIALGRGLALSGRGDDAIRVAERCFDPDLRTADEIDGAGTRAAATIFLSHLCCGRLDEAEQLARFQYDLAMRLHSPTSQGPGAASLGLIELLRGRVATAASLLMEADLGLRRADVFGMRTLCLGSLAQALVLCGRDRAAAEALSEAEESGRAWVNWFDWAVEVGRAWLLARSDRAEGARVAMDAGDNAARRRQLPFASWAYHAAVRISPSTRAAHRLWETADRCDGPFPEAMAMRASALMAADSKGLLQASEAFERLGMLLLAAESSAHAALLNVRQGRRAEPIRKRALLLAGECEEAWSPVLEDLSSSPIGLSRREMTVARLAREGRSSTEIAAMLDISVRTVDSHLASVYLKLGIGGRLDLADTLDRVPIGRTQR